MITESQRKSCDQNMAKCIQFLTNAANNFAQQEDMRYVSAIATIMAGNELRFALATKQYGDNIEDRIRLWMKTFHDCMQQLGVTFDQRGAA